MLKQIICKFIGDKKTSNDYIKELRRGGGKNRRRNHFLCARNWLC